jgi:hypothetical protein
MVLRDHPNGILLSKFPAKYKVRIDSAIFTILKHSFIVGGSYNFIDCISFLGEIWFVLGICRDRIQQFKGIGDRSAHGVQIREVHLKQ